MTAIRIPKSQRANAWRAMIELAPVRLVAKDPIYEVCPAHLELLKARAIPYEVVSLSPRLQEKRRRATSN